VPSPCPIFVRLAGGKQLDNHRQVQAYMDIAARRGYETVITLSNYAASGWR
jgi:hypothetical protein